MRSRALYTVLFLSILALAGCGSTASANLAPPLVFPTAATGPSGPAPLSVYVSASSQKSGSVYALNAQSGGRRWQYPSKTAIGYTYLDSGVVYFGAADGKLYALDAGSGSVKWNHALGAFPSVIGIANGILYAGTTNFRTAGTGQPGTVYALNASDGALKWQSKNTGFVGGMDSSALYLITSDNHVVAVNTSDGSLKWDYQADNVPTIMQAANGQVYIITGPIQNGQHLAFYALNASDGRVQWRFPGGTDVTAMGGVAVGSDTVYLEANTATGQNVYTASTLFALSTQDGSTRWQTTLQGTALNTALLDSGTLYATSGGGHVFALNTQDGSVFWAITAGNGYPAIEAIDSSMLYAASSNDGLYALSTSDGSTHWHYTSDAFVAVFAVTNGIVYAATIPAQNPNEHSTLLALNPADGSALWHYDAGIGSVIADVG